MLPEQPAALMFKTSLLTVPTTGHSSSNPTPSPPREPSQPDSIFLSRAWFNASVASWQGRADFRELRIDDGPRGPVVALIGRRLEVRHNLLPVRVLALNQSICSVLDQPWIERNGFFGGRPEYFEDNLAALLDQLGEDPRWDELRLGGLVAEHARQALYQAARHGLTARLDLEQPSYNIDLDAVRNLHGGDYLKALSPNTRQQLRRSRRQAERDLGPLELSCASTLAEALQWFDETGPLHRARWGTPDGDSFDSGFDNPEFVGFHRRLLAEAFPGGSVQYLRLSAGGRPLAYLYNFVSGRNVHFYLSGINYEVDEAIRPGMLAHWLAIERNIEMGMGLYDFLAGDARYKRSLSTGEDRTLWLVLQRPRWRLQFESWARRLKRSWAGSEMDDLRRIPHPVKLR